MDQFKADRTFTLILRLHHNVIKTAIRRISLAYSRISLADVAAKLNLESPKDAEYIIAKVIINADTAPFRVASSRRVSAKRMMHLSSKRDKFAIYVQCLPNENPASLFVFRNKL